MFQIGTSVRIFPHTYPSNEVEGKVVSYQAPTIVVAFPEPPAFPVEHLKLAHAKYGHLFIAIHTTRNLWEEFSHGYTFSIEELQNEEKMHFTFNQHEYRLAFAYPVTDLVKDEVFRKGDTTWEIKQTWHAHRAFARIYCKTAGPNPKTGTGEYHWVPVLSAESQCSRKDVHNRVKARLVAFERLMYLMSNSPEFGLAGVAAARTSWKLYIETARRLSAAAAKKEGTNEPANQTA